MKNLSVAIMYASAWMATSIAVVFGIKYTGSTWCLWTFILLAFISIKWE